MENNDILRRIRYIFDYGDDPMMNIFDLAMHEVTRSLLSDWLRKDDEPTFEIISDYQLAVFLNGLIILHRGPQDGPTPEPEEVLTNNIILRKIKIALNLKTEEVVDLMIAGGGKVTSTELSAFMRRPNHRHYKELNNQYLRNFLTGLQQKHRPKVEKDLE